MRSDIWNVSYIELRIWNIWNISYITSHKGSLFAGSISITATYNHRDCGWKVCNFLVLSFFFKEECLVERSRNFLLYHLSTSRKGDPRRQQMHYVSLMSDWNFLCIKTVFKWLVALSGWLKNVAPVFQPMRGKAKPNRTLYTRFFARFKHVPRNCCEFWLVVVISLVLFFFFYIHLKNARTLGFPSKVTHPDINLVQPGLTLVNRRKPFRSARTLLSDVVCTNIYCFHRLLCRRSPNTVVFVTLVCWV